jgi:hypothetical protein
MMIVGKEASMIHIHLSDEESSIILQLLNNSLEEINIEIEQTDNAEYKEMLRGRKASFIRLVEEIDKAKRNILTVA